MKVVDASVAVKWVFDEPGSRRARDLLEADHALSAPRFWLIEAANVLRRKSSEGKLSGSDARARTALLGRLPIETADELPLLDGALDLALRLDHALYGCIYLALAREQRSVLVTADGRFAKAALLAGYSDLIELIGPDQP